MMSWLIARHEWRRLFASPLAWISLGLVQLVCGVVFVILLGEFANTAPEDTGQGVALFVGGGLFGFASFVLLLLIPLLSMRSVAEERSQGSLDLLLSAPVSSLDIILGKYVALTGFCFLMLLLLGAMPASLSIGATIDWGILLGNALGLGLLAASFAAIGVLMSSIAAQPIVAALLSFATLLLLWLTQAAAGGHGDVMAVVEYLSPLLHLDALRRGILNTQDLLYFLILSTAFVGLSTLALDWPRAKPRRPQLVLNTLLWGYILILCTILNHWHLRQYDLSLAGINSLRSESRELLEKMPDPIQATAWIEPGLEARQQIRARFNAYMAEKSDFSLQFVDPASDPGAVRELGLSGSGEVVIEYQGRREILDTLSEADISQALQRLSQTTRSKIVFLGGHGERSVKDTGPAGYSALAQLLTSKGLQIHQQSLALDDLPIDTRLLIIAASRTQPLPIERQRIEQFLFNGGSLLLLFDPDTRAPESLLLALGLSAMAGAQVFPDYQSIGAAHPALAVQTQYPDHPVTAQLDQITAFPVAGGLSVTDSQAWQHAALLLSDQRSWLETGKLEDKIQFDKETDTAGPILYGISAERGLQRAVVIADSDFMANSYLPQLGNQRFSLELIHWLLNDGDTLRIDLPQAIDAQLTLSPRQSQVIAIVFVLVVPLCLFAVALFQFLRRRAR